MRKGYKYIFFLLLFALEVTGGRGTPVRSDTAYVWRTPDATFLEPYRADPEFDYGRNVLRVEGFWEMLWRHLQAWLFRHTDSEQWQTLFDVLLGVLLLAAMGCGAWLVLRERKRLGGRRAKEFAPELFEDITTQDETSYHRLLTEAESAADFVLAIRVRYAALLQLLDRREIIHWQASKSNRMYYYEIQNKEWRKRFGQLSDIFNCVCYGEFRVDAGVYQRVGRCFTDLEREVKA